MAIKVQGDTGTTAEVSATDKALVVQASPTQAQAGHVIANAEVSTASDPGGRTVRALDMTPDFRARVGIDNILQTMTFEGAIVPTHLLNQSLLTFTVTQGTGHLRLNAGSSVLASQYAIVTTRRFFPLHGTYPTYLDMWVRTTNETVAGNVSEWGFGLATTTVTPTDGAFFRIDAAGTLYGVVNYAGAERTTAALTVPTTNFSHHYLIVVDIDAVEFWINGALAARLNAANDLPSCVSASSQPVFFRAWNSGTPASARYLDVGAFNVTLGDANSNRDWAYAMAANGGSAVHQQPGVAVGPTVTRTSGAAGWPGNTTARVAGTWTATSAPALNSLGGLWTSPAIQTLVSDSDYPVFSYLNQPGSNALPGKTLMITSIRCGEAYASIAAATNAIFLSCIVVVGSTGAATNIADAATTIAGKAVVVGGYGFTAAAAQGSVQPGFEVTFPTPLVVPPNTYFSFVIRPVGTVTTNALVVHSSLAVNGYFE